MTNSTPLCGVVMFIVKMLYETNNLTENEATFVHSIVHAGLKCYLCLQNVVHSANAMACMLALGMKS